MVLLDNLNLLGMDSVEWRELLEFEGVLIGSGFNKGWPYSSFINAAFFYVTFIRHEEQDGSTQVTARQLFVTDKGVEFLKRRFKSEAKEEVV